MSDHKPKRPQYYIEHAFNRSMCTFTTSVSGYQYSHIKLCTVTGTVDSDITIRSSDGVLLYLHRKNLEAISRALKTSEFLADSDNGVITLPEHSDLLRTVFSFIYPHRHPKLQGLEFETLLEISDAVQKYEIFSAMNTCDDELRLM